MPYRYLEHIGDAAIEATGATLEAAFSAAAEAMCGLMIDARGMSPETRVAILARGETREELFVAFLNELLAQQGLRDCVFIRCGVREISRAPGGGYLLRGEAGGVAPGRAEGRLGPEVKAASCAGLKLEEGEGRFVIRFILDL